MTRTINQISDARDTLLNAKKSLVGLEITHLDDGQKSILWDVSDRIDVSIRELNEVENELRYGTTWSEPS